MRLIWSQLSPEAKNEAVAIHVEKWKLDPNREGSWIPPHAVARNDGSYYTARPNLYLSSREACLMLLGSDYDVRVRNHTACKVTIYRPSEQFDGYAPTVNEAAMIALLRANGVEVEAP